MEVKETAACGIAEREFAIEFEDDDLIDMYRVMRYVENGVGFYEEDFLEDLQSQMLYIIGPSVEEDPPEEIVDNKMEWEDTGTSYNLNFNDETVPLQVMDRVGPGGNFLMEAHTSANFKKSFWFPRFFDRNNFETWEENGSKDLLATLNENAKNIFAECQPEDVSEEAKSKIEDIVAKHNPDVS